ncbi:MAG: HIT family protein [Candidatus Izemoplasmataceae bacterium]|jgi:histidine triad (HIT) family protein|uniref:HIT family protein n=1 Tax=Liberiplasma polymorphum TaxID=3374570 RepID=UPI003773B9AD
MDCIFCKIVKGEIPSYKVYENDVVYAFLDISQGTKGHTLIIPKTHSNNVYDLPEVDAHQVFGIVPKLANALKKAFNPIGLNIISNNEKPHQTVDHFHVHLIPRYEDDGMVLSILNNFEDYEQKDYVDVLDAIKSAMKS